MTLQETIQKYNEVKRQYIEGNNYDKFNLMPLLTYYRDSVIIEAELEHGLIKEEELNRLRDGGY